MATASAESTAVFITGASRGFGRAVAVALARSLTSGGSGAAVFLVLLARDAAGLSATRTAVIVAAPAAHVVAAPPLDLADLDSVEAGFGAAVAALAAARTAAAAGNAEVPALTRAVLVHNAGSGGPVAYVAGLCDLAAIRAAVDLGATSCLWLTAIFLRFSAASSASSTAAVRCELINVSSLAAVAPFASMAVYSSVKAFRDMLMRVVADESGGLVTRTLSYAPGPMDTELQSEMRSAPGLHAPTRAFFDGMAASDSWVRLDASASKLARLISHGDYVSGAHVDFYDVTA